MTTLSERLQWAFDRAKAEDPTLTRTSLAKAGGVSNSAVSDWLSGRRLTMRGDSAIRIADYLGVSVKWLTTGDGTPESSRISIIDEIKDIDNSNLVAIPKYKIRLSAGGGAIVTPDEMEESCKVFLPRSWFHEHHISPSQCKGFTVSGSSMEPVLWDGDCVVVDCSYVEYSQIKDGAIYAFSYFGELKIKRLYKANGRGLIVVSFNPDVPQETLSFDDLECFGLIGRVIYHQGRMPY